MILQKRAQLLSYNLSTHGSIWLQRLQVGFISSMRDKIIEIMGDSALLIWSWLLRLLEMFLHGFFVLGVGRLFEIKLIHSYCIV